MERSKLLDKIKALLAKTVERGCTEAEALAALEKARAMMDAHDVTDTDLAFGDESVVQESAKRSDPDNIRWRLCGAVGKFCDCRVWGSNNSDTITFFGLESDTMFATWLLSTLEAFVRRQSLQFLADMGKGKAGVSDLFGAPLNGHEREHKRRSFVLGCVGRISQRLWNAAQQREQHVGGVTTNALVVKKNALVEREYKALGLKLRKGRAQSMKNTDTTAYLRGVNAGDRATFSRPVSGNRATLAIGR